VEADPLGATSRAAVFAGGDLLAQPRTVAHALGSGKRAAIGIDRFLRAGAGESAPNGRIEDLRFGPRGNLSMTRWRGDDPVRRAAEVNEVVPWEAMNPNHFAHAPRHADRHGAAARLGEVNAGLPPDVALQEARRCLNCGVCNGCELCLIFCPDVAILRRENGGFAVAYDFCKGCGVCAAECPRGSIVMTREGT